MGHCKTLFISKKVKVKQSRYTPWTRLGGRRYSSYSFTTSALDEGEWSASRPGRAFTPGERTPPVPIVQEAGWAPEPVWTQRLEKKILCSCRGSNPDRPVVQPVVRHYTAWANPAPSLHQCWILKYFNAATYFNLKYSYLFRRRKYFVITSEY
jgi:hypothetical protein